jgi:threonine dehydrogenase-like Zn-dependent dehydrogenase
MRALWLQDRQLEYIDDLQVPDPGPGEALVKVRLAGICATDLELVKGYYPFSGVLGHEFVGEIAGAPASPERIGQRVVGEINAVCGECTTCLRGDRTHCENRTVLGIAGRHGAFADYLVLPLENLIPVPEGLSDETAVFVEPLAASLEILEQVHIHPTDRVLVVGAGRLGQLISRVLKMTGCDLTVLARHPRQQAASQRAGVQAISVIGGDSYDLVVEASGSPSGFETARKALRPRGRLVLKSTYAGKLEIDMSAVVVDELTLIGSRCGPFLPALRMMAEGKIDPTDLIDLIDQVVPLDQGLEAFEYATLPTHIKVLLSIN